MTGLLLQRARLHDGDAPVDIAIADGRIVAIGPGLPLAGEAIDLRGGLVWPGLADLHTHLDKGHIWPRAPNPDGSFAGALATVAADRRANWNEADVAARFGFGLRCAYAHGTVAIRTHLDSLSPQYQISWPLFARFREQWAGRITLQAAAIVGVEALADPDYARGLAATVARYGGAMGGVLRPMEGLAGHIATLVRLAADHGLDLDLHVDETLDGAARSLPLLARALLDARFGGRVVVGHCCSLTAQTPDEIERTLDLMAAANIAVVSLPMCNMYLQDRVAGRTPRRRGVTLLHEMAARGIPVAIASDNCRDPFYAYGDHDLLEVYREAVRIAHLDHSDTVWRNAVTSTPAGLMGLAAAEVSVGAPADLILFRARSLSELLSRPQSDRIVLRAGRTIDTTPPDYAELDGIMAVAPDQLPR